MWIVFEVWWLIPELWLEQYCVWLGISWSCQTVDHQLLSSDVSGSQKSWRMLVIQTSKLLPVMVLAVGCSLWCIAEITSGTLVTRTSTKCHFYYACKARTQQCGPKTPWSRYLNEFCRTGTWSDKELPYGYQRVWHLRLHLGIPEMTKSPSLVICWVSWKPWSFDRMHQLAHGSDAVAEAMSSQDSGIWNDCDCIHYIPPSGPVASIEQGWLALHIHSPGAVIRHLQLQWVFVLPGRCAIWKTYIVLSSAWIWIDENSGSGQGPLAQDFDEWFVTRYTTKKSLHPWVKYFDC